MSTVTTRKHGKGWSYRFTITENGKRRFHEKSGFATKEEAYAAGVAAFTDWQHGNIGITSERVTFKDFARLWLDNVAKLNVRPSTCHHYQTQISLYLVPHIGTTILQEITPVMLDGLMRKLVQQGLARNTIRNVWARLRSVLDYAVYPTELLQSNPANYIKVPRSAPASVVKRSIVTPDEYATLLHDFPFGTDYHVPIALLYHTGMRISEVLGLCWQDVDLAAKAITIRRQIINFDKGLVFAPPKTESSRRTVLIDGELADLLAKWKVQQETYRHEGGASYCHIYELPDHNVKICSRQFAPPDASCQDIICTRKNGRPVQRSSVSVNLQKYGLNAHSFRHTHATLLIEAGASPKAVAGRLGHKNVNITENLYTHQTRQMQEAALSIFEKKLRANASCGQNVGK